MKKSEAYLDGWLAHRKGVSVDDNPYDEESQARSHRQWSSGWTARFSACKHDLPLDYDDFDWED